MTEQTIMTVEDNKKPELCSVTETTIAEMSEKYLTLTIKGIDDDAGALAVKEAKQKCVTARGQVNTWHKAEKEYWLVGGRKVDAVKNKMIPAIERIESHLKSEEKRIEDELAAIVRRKDDARENARKILVNEAGGIPPILQQSMMPNFIRVAEESSFLEWLESVRAMNLTIKQQEEDRIEQLRLAKIEADRAKAEKDAADLKAKQDAEKLAAENKRIADELAETKRKLDEQAAAQKKAQDDIDAKQKELDDAREKAVAAMYGGRPDSAGGYSVEGSKGYSRTGEMQFPPIVEVTAKKTINNGALTTENIEQAYATYRPASVNQLMGILPFDLVSHIREQIAWSTETFGPGNRTEQVLDHIEQEMIEVRKNPSDVIEWIDIAMLAIDGAWREGHSAEEVAEAFGRKLAINKARKWPDWRTVDPNKAIQHIEE